MTIHDEILWSLTQPDERGRIPLYEMVGQNELHHKVEYSYNFWDSSKAFLVKMVPDIILSRTTPNGRHWIIEVENDLQWDFSGSLRQIKKYQEYLTLSRGSQRYIAIIPDLYERFVPMYQNEGIDVWTWEAERIWQCIKCDELIFEKKSIKPQCTECKDKHVRLFGLKNFILHEKQPPRKIVRRKDTFLNDVNIT